MCPRVRDFTGSNMDIHSRQSLSYVKAPASLTTYRGFLYPATKLSNYTTKLTNFPFATITLRGFKNAPHPIKGTALLSIIFHARTTLSRVNHKNFLRP
jgi:hypothetical protein